ncbi:hypothetical protein [Paludibacterium denitrificans]|uniref:hypothetical protein n=1 Tax=Paludibacterium denitrificans TaxID=2675226 RepID=UPI001E350726|nr:hypothetical protein [Paludibacterium denitrificans]
MQALAQRFPAGQPRELARQRLTAAITGFDAAAIYTIHGFCQRVLTDAAFESGQTFAAELVTDDERRLSEAVDDFWRRRVVTDPLLARVLAESGDTPDGWLADIRPHLAKSYLRFSSPAPGVLEQARAQVTAALAKVGRKPGTVDDRRGVVAHDPRLQGQYLWSGHAGPADRQFANLAGGAGHRAGAVQS